MCRFLERARFSNGSNKISSDNFCWILRMESGTREERQASTWAKLDSQKKVNQPLTLMKETPMPLPEFLRSG